MHCSLLSIKGALPNKLLSDDYTIYGEQAKLKFIKLKHKKGFAMNQCASVRGYQGADIVVSQTRDHQILYEVALTTDNKTGEACSAQRPLIFEPEKRTNLLTAVVPDTPFNRKKLACVYYHNPFAEIIDEAIDKEIDQMAREIELILPQEKTKDDTIQEQDDEISILRRKLSEQTSKIDGLKVTAGIAEDARDSRVSNTPEVKATPVMVPKPDRLLNQEEEPSEVPVPKVPETFEELEKNKEPEKELKHDFEPESEEPLEPVVRDPGKFPTNEGDLKVIRKKIVGEVQKEMSELINKLKKESEEKGTDPRFIVNKREYKETVLPEINRRYKEYTDAHNPGAGIDN